jgi:hypothetical protein
MLVGLEVQYMKHFLKSKKGQTAMEYLMTYGWAIIIVVVVFIALWRLGVFTPTAGAVATGFNEFTVGSDFKIDVTGTATVKFANADKQARSITVNEATVNANACTGDTGTKGPGESWTITCINATGAGTAGSTYSAVQVQIQYVVGGINHTETGSISGEYELA